MKRKYPGFLLLESSLSFMLLVSLSLIVCSTITLMSEQKQQQIRKLEASRYMYELVTQYRVTNQIDFGEKNLATGTLVSEGAYSDIAIDHILITGECVGDSQLKIERLKSYEKK